MQVASLKKNQRKNFKINMPEHKVTGYRYVSRRNKDSIPKKGYECRSRRKMPKRKTKMGITAYERW
jgi:hypothetical protein